MKPALQLPIVLVAFLFLTACANLERNAYRTIGSIVVAVDTAMEGWGEYVRAGKATPDEQAVARKLYVGYQNSMSIVKAAVVAHRKNPNEIALQQATVAASAAAEDLVVWIAEYVPVLKKKDP